MQQQMKELEIDTDKMPLGKLSKDQIKKGEKVLEEIEAELTNAEKDKRKPKQTLLVDATNRFYSHVPHYFPGGTRPTIIDNKDLLQKKYDLIGVRLWNWGRVKWLDGTKWTNSIGCDCLDFGRYWNCLSYVRNRDLDQDSPNGRYTNLVQFCGWFGWANCCWSWWWWW